MDAVLKRLSDLGIILLPSAYCAIFIFWHYGNALPNISGPYGLNEKSIILAVSILFGIIIYYSHRGVFHHIVWKVQKRYYGIPQYQFHQKICDELYITGPIKNKIGISQACLYFTQISEAESYRVSTERFNRGSHILYLNSLMLFLFSLYDIFRVFIVFFSSHGPQPEYPLLGIFELFIAFFLFYIALFYDRLADYREIVFLTQRKSRYRDIVMNLHKYNGGLTKT